MIYFILAFSAVAAVSNLLVGRHYHTALSTIVFACYLYGTGWLIGFRASFDDLVGALRRLRSWRAASRALAVLGSRELALPPLV